MAKKVMLVCSAGMSTSLLVKKMQTAAIERGLEIDVFSASQAEAKEYFDEISILLLGPQVRYLEGELKKVLDSMGIPMLIIDSRDYGTINGEKVLDEVLAELKKGEPPGFHEEKEDKP